MKRTKTLSLLLAVILAFTVVFALPGQTMAASVKVNENLITQIKTKESQGGYYIRKFEYNKKGLLTKEKIYHDSVLSRTITYKYNSDNLVSSVIVQDPDTSGQVITLTNTYENKKLVKRVSKSKILGSTTTEKYTYKNGLVSKVSSTTKGGWYAGKSTTTYTYDKKGVLSKRVIKGNESASTSTFKYDSNGFLTKYTYDNNYESGYITRKLTYKNGVLTKYQDTDVNGGEKYSDNARMISSKAVQIPKAVSATVKGQQCELINGNYGQTLYLGFQ